MNHLICVHHEYLSVAVYVMADAISPVQPFEGLQMKIVQVVCLGHPTAYTIFPQAFALVRLHGNILRTLLQIVQEQRNYHGYINRH